jgi:hypothetical protein
MVIWTNASLKQRLGEWRLPGRTKKPVESFIFPLAPAERRGELISALKTMHQLERMGFLSRLAWLWQRSDKEAKREITECLGQAVGDQIGRTLLVQTHSSGQYLYIWILHPDHLFPDANGSRRDLLCLVKADQETIEQLRLAADLF